MPSFFLATFCRSQFIVGLFGPSESAGADEILQWPGTDHCWRRFSRKSAPDLMERSCEVMRTLFLQAPSFDGFDGGAGSRYQAKREVRSFWYPTWLAPPAALVGGRRRGS